MPSSRIPGFYRLGQEDRIKKIKENLKLSDEDVKLLGSGLKPKQADGMIENVIGVYSLPLGVALNFKINDKDYLIPMATEESSVVAAASNAAKIFRSAGGFKACSTKPLMFGQLQVTGCSLPEAASNVLEKKKNLLDLANQADPVLVEAGGGAQDVRARILGDLLVVHLVVNVADAMGANAVNSMCESVAPLIEDLSGGRVNFKILSNYAVERTASAEASIPIESLGDKVAADIVSGFRFAQADVYRAATHNKGIMNGVSAVCLATGNDTRAIESGAHAYACRNGIYQPLSSWEIIDDSLKGFIKLPVAVGIVGGGTMHPTARLMIQMLGVSSSRELGEVLACVGLAQNFAALKALASEGIQKGHMRLHARNIALIAGASGSEVEQTANLLIEADNIRVDEAKKILAKLRGGNN